MQMASALNLLSLFDTQTCLVAVVVFCLAYYLFFSTSSELPPGPRAWPIVGNLLDIKTYGPVRAHIYYSDMQKKYGNVYKIYFGGWLMVVVNGYEAVHEVLVKQGMLLSYRPVWLASHTSKNVRGLIWNDGEEWKQLRRMTLRAFRDLGVGKSTLEERITEEAICLMDVMASKEGQPFKVRDDLSKAVANIIYSVIFGSRFEYTDPIFEELISATNAMFRSQAFLSGVSAVPALRFLPSFKRHVKPYHDAVVTVRKYTEKQIEEHRRTFEDQEERDYVDIFLKHEKENPDSHIITGGNLTKCIIDLLLAGTETSAATLDFALLYMIKYPDVQDKCQKEIDKDEVSPEETAGTDLDISGGNLTRCVIDLVLAGTETSAATLDFVLLYMIKYPDVQDKCQKEIDKVVGVERAVKLSDRPSLAYTQATILEIQRMASIAPFGMLRTCTKDTWVGGYRIPRGCIIHTNIYSVLHDPDRWDDPKSFHPERFITPNKELIHLDSWIPFGEGPRMCVGEILAKMEVFLFFSNLLQRFHFSKADTSEPDIDPCFGLTMNPKPYALVLHRRF